MKTLMPFQFTGSLFLQLHRHCLLADDMGLGKTVQAIDAIIELGLIRILVVCPAVAKFNWQAEFTDAGLSSHLMGGKKNRTPTQNICIGSFEFWTDYVYKLKEYPHHHSHYDKSWDLVIVDEGHFLKEPTSGRTKAVVGINGLIHMSKRLWALSGTPAPNHAGELWVWLYTFGYTKLSYEGFISRYCNSYREGNRYAAVRITGTNTLRSEELKGMLKRCSLRRLKKDELDLPPMYHSTYYIEGSTDAEVFKRAPGLKEKLEEELAILKEKLGIDDLDSEKILSTLSFFSQSLSSLRRYHGIKKVIGTADLIKSEMREGQYKKIVIFGVHKDVIGMLMDELKEFNPVAIVGGVSDAKRKFAMETFQDKESDCGIIMGNIKAMGTAVTLTAAKEILFIEQDWVPGNNKQAGDRVYRIGQDETVNCRHVAIKDSLDAKFTSTLQRKIQEISTFISE